MNQHEYNRPSYTSLYTTDTHTSIQFTSHSTTGESMTIDDAPRDNGHARSRGRACPIVFPA